MPDKLDSWTESVETYVLEVIFNRRQGNRADLLRGVLHALSKIFESAVKLRRILYDIRILRDRTLKKMSETEWQDVIDTNLTGVFNACKSVIDRISDNGRIISIASLAAATGFFGQANYVSAKAGVIGLTKVLSKEVARKGITVNAVAPGVINTEMGESIPEENKKWMISQVPMGRFGEPDEIAKVVLFLASDLASYVTGQTVHVNGGWWG